MKRNWTNWKEKLWEKGRLQRYLSLFLVAVLVTTQCTTSKGVSLVTAQTSCTEHAEHDDKCGYVKAVEGVACDHKCGEECQTEQLNCKHEHNEECGYVAAREGTLCQHTCGDGMCNAVAAVDEKPCTFEHSEEVCGCTGEENAENCTHVCEETVCGYAEAIAEIQCDHEHEETVCGYTEGTPETPCNHEHTEVCYEMVQACQHVCGDGSCGFVTEVIGAECNHTCKKCTAIEDEELTEEQEEVIEEETEEIEIIEETVSAPMMLATAEEEEEGVAINEENFPDPKFLEYVSYYCDTEDENGEKDGVLTSEEIANVITIDLCGENLGDSSEGEHDCGHLVERLDGIEFFTELKYLYCNVGKLKGELNVSSNINLRGLYCSSNELIALNIGNITSLSVLDCADNNITKLSVKNQSNMWYLTCGDNYSLSELDIEGSTGIVEMYLGNCNLTELDLEACSDLEHLSCQNNDLTNLKISSNATLKRLYAPGNCLSNVDIDISNWTGLYSFDLSGQRVGNLPLYYDSAANGGNGAWVNIAKNSAERSTSFGEGTAFTITEPTTEDSPLALENGNLIATSNEPSDATVQFSKIYGTDINGKECTLSGTFTYTMPDKIYKSQFIDVNVAKGLTTANDLYQFFTDEDDAEAAPTSSVAAISEGQDISVTCANFGQLNDGVPGFYPITLSVNGTKYSTAVEVVVDIDYCDEAGNYLNFPDTVFREYLIAREKNATVGNGDGYFTSDELKKVKVIDVAGTASAPKNCSNLTGIEYFTNLTDLYCYYNKLTKLDLSSNRKLITLGCHGNSILELDVSDCVDLVTLTAQDNKLTKLDLSSNAKLNTLHCANNRLTELNVTGADNLQYLYFSTNYLTEIDLEHNDKLSAIECWSNQLTSLNLAHVENLTRLHCESNDLDTLVLGTKPKMTALYVNNNNLTSLDLRGVPNLATLTCQDNNLSSIIFDVNGAVNLTTLRCSNNELAGLNLSNPSGLKTFEGTGQNVGNLSMYQSGDTWTNAANGDEADLVKTFTPTSVSSTVFYKDAGMTSASEVPESPYNFKVSETSSLLTAAEVLPMLEKVYFKTTLTGTSHVLSGNFTYHASNSPLSAQFTYLDINDATGLKEEKDLIDYLVLEGISINEDSDFTIMCDKFDEMQKGTFGEYTVHVATGNAECDVTVVVAVEVSANNFPDSYFRNYVSSSFDKDKNGYLTSAELGAVTKIAISGKSSAYNNYADLTGIEYFANLETLVAHYCKLTKLDVSQNPKLTNIGCGYNKISEIDISNCKDLLALQIMGNQLTELDVSDSEELYELHCANNQLTELDVHSNKSLQNLYFSGNNIAEINLETNTGLKRIECWGNGLTVLDVSKSTDLNYLLCHNNDLSLLVLPETANSLATLQCSDNKLSSLDLNGAPNLTTLTCGRNALTSLNLPNPDKLTTFNGNGQKIGNLSMYADGNAWVNEDNGKETDLAQAFTVGIDTTFYQDAAMSEEDEIARFEVDESTGFMTATDVLPMLGRVYFKSVLSTTKGWELSGDFTYHMLEIGLSAEAVYMDVNTAKDLDNVGELAEYFQISGTNVLENPVFTVEGCQDFEEKVQAGVPGQYEVEIQYGENSCIAVLVVAVELNAINFPDDNFREYVYTNFDKDSNRFLTAGELAGVYTISRTGTATAVIETTSLQGIEHFTNLESLTVKYTLVRELDLSDFTNLKTVSVTYNNDLTILNLDRASSMTTLTCDYNAGLKELSLEGSSSLATLQVRYNDSLESLDLSKTQSLTTIAITYNSKLKSLVLGEQLKLWEVNCMWNAIQILDLSECSAMTRLYAQGNNMISINLGDASKLTILHVAFNDLTELDVSSCKKLEKLYFAGNLLTEIDLSNNLNLKDIEAYENIFLTLLDLSNQPYMTRILCRDSSLSSLILGNKPYLTYLNCESNVLTELDLSRTPMLATLHCYNNELKNLDVGKLINLTDLRCYNNALTTLDISNLKKLTTFDASGQTLGTLSMYQDGESWSNQAGTSETDFVREFSKDNTTFHKSSAMSEASEIEYFSLNKDGILQATQITPMVQPVYYKVALTSTDYTLTGSFNYSVPEVLSIENGYIDVNDTEALTVQDDLLEYFDLTGIDIEGNQTFSLTCADFAAVKAGTVGQYEVVITCGNYSCVTTLEVAVKIDDAGGKNFPNTAFRFYVSNAGYDLDNNGYLTLEELQKVTVIDLLGNSTSHGCSDLTGIEHFVNMEELYCQNGGISTLDISKNTMLTILNCDDNALTELDVTNNERLLTLSCAGNDLKQLDLSSQIRLETLDCAENNLETLDVSTSYRSLKTLDCTGNALTSVDLSTMQVLDEFAGTGQTVAGTLSMYQDASGDWVNEAKSSKEIFRTFNIKASTSFFGGPTQGDSLEGNLSLNDDGALVVAGTFENHPQSVFFSSKQTVNEKDFTLSGTFGYSVFTVGISDAYIDVKDAKDTIEEEADLLKYFNISGATESETTAIDIDNTDFETKVTQGIPGQYDVTITVGETPRNAVLQVGVRIDDTTHFTDEEFLEIVSAFDTGTDKEVFLTAAELDAVTTIELGGSTAQYHKCSSLTGIEYFTNLETLYAGYGQLTGTLDLSNNQKLTTLYCQYNALTGIDISANAMLETLSCTDNALSTLELGSKPELTHVYAYNNHAIEEVDVSQTPKLEYLDLSYNNLRTIDLSSNTALETAYLQYNALTEVGVSQNPNLKILHLRNNDLTEIDVSSLRNLTSLYIGENDLTTLNTTKSLNLAVLECQDNALQTVDLSKNEKLTTLYCYNNELQELSLDSNWMLNSLYCYGNKLNSLNVSCSSELTTLNCQDNELVSLSANDNPKLATLNCSNNALSKITLSNPSALTSFAGTGQSLGTLSMNLTDEESGIWMNSAAEGENGLVKEFNTSGTTFYEASAMTDTSKLREFYVSSEGFLKVKDEAITPMISPVYFKSVLGSTSHALSGSFSYSIPEVVIIEKAFIDVNAAKALTTQDGLITYFNLDEIQTGEDENITYSVSCADFSKVMNGILGIYDVTIRYGEYLCMTSLEVAVEIEDAGEINFPDENFRAYIADNTNISGAEDGFLTLEELEAVTVIDVTGNGASHNCSDFTGIEYFTKLEELYCKNGSFTKLDLSSNKELLTLDCGNNGLTSLDVSENTKLTSLNCVDNALEELDVSGLLRLTELQCSGNSLRELNVNNNRALTSVSCKGNALSYLDLSKNTKLTAFEGTDQQLGTLSMHQDKKGNWVNEAKNSKEIFAKFHSETGFNAEGLTLSAGALVVDKDLTQHPQNVTFTNTQTINGTDCTLTGTFNYILLEQGASDGYIDVADAADSTIISEVTDLLDYFDLYGFTAEEGADAEILCENFETHVKQGILGQYGVTIKIGESEAIETVLEVGVRIDNDTHFTDAVFREYIAEAFDDEDSFLTLNELERVTVIDISGTSDTDRFGCRELTGIEYFTNLKELYCSYARLEGTLNLSGNPALQILDCSYNVLTALNVENNSNLEELNCAGNQLSELDVDQNQKLTSLSCGGNNGMTALDVSANAQLTVLNISNTETLKTLNVRGLRKLAELYCENNSLEALDLTNLSALTVLHCYNNDLQTLDVSDAPDLTTLRCESNQLTTMNLNGNTKLNSFNGADQKLGMLSMYEKSGNNEETIWVNEVQKQSVDIVRTFAYGATTFYSSEAMTVGLITDYFTVNEAGILTGTQIIPMLSAVYFRTELTDTDFELTGSFTYGLSSMLSAEIAYMDIDVAKTLKKLSQLIEYFTITNGTGETEPSYSIICQDFVDSIMKGIPGRYDVTIKLGDYRCSTALEVGLDMNNSQITEARFPNEAFRSYISNAENIPGAEDKFLTSEELESVKQISISDENCTDITGIEYFTSLETLDCSGCSLAELDVSALKGLKVLKCSYNQTLDSLDVRQNTKLEELYCSFNNLSTLDVSKNTVLTELYCDNNHISTIDLSGQKYLTVFSGTDQTLGTLPMVYNTGISRWLNEDTAKNDTKEFAPNVTAFYNSLSDRTELDNFGVTKDGVLTAKTVMTIEGPIAFESALKDAKGKSRLLNGTFDYIPEAGQYTLSANTLYFRADQISRLNLSGEEDLKNLPELFTVNSTGPDAESFKKAVTTTMENFDTFLGGTVGDYTYTATLTLNGTISADGTLQVLDAEHHAVSQDHTAYLYADSFYITTSTLEALDTATVIEKASAVYKDNLGTEFTDAAGFALSETEFASLQNGSAGMRYPLTITHTESGLAVKVEATVLNDEVTDIVILPAFITLERNGSISEAEETIELLTSEARPANEAVESGTSVNVSTATSFQMVSDAKDILNVGVYDENETRYDGKAPLAVLDAETTKRVFKLISGDVTNLRGKTYTGTMKFTITYGDSN